MIIRVDLKDQPLDMADVHHLHNKAFHNHTKAIEELAEVRTLILNGTIKALVWNGLKITVAAVEEIPPVQADPSRTYESVSGRTPALAERLRPHLI